MRTGIGTRFFSEHPRGSLVLGALFAILGVGYLAGRVAGAVSRGEEYVMGLSCFVVAGYFARCAWLSRRSPGDKAVRG